MRELKFRAWFPDGHWYVKPKDSRMLYDFQDTTACEIFSFNDEDEGIIFMQFTGLLDKNGKEIYEGDIVLYKKLISVVEWMWYMWIFKHKDMGDMAQDHVVASSHSSVTIIGNIHENPDLL